eukprot:766655-Hanusia_phi.AAC.8
MGRSSMLHHAAEGGRQEQRVVSLLHPDPQVLLRRVDKLRRPGPAPRARPRGCNSIAAAANGCYGSVLLRAQRGEGEEERTSLKIEQDIARRLGEEKFLGAVAALCEESKQGGVVANSAAALMLIRALSRHPCSAMAVLEAPALANFVRSMVSSPNLGELSPS